MRILNTQYRRTSPTYPLPSQPLWTVLKDHLITFIIYYFPVLVNFFYVSNQANQQNLEVLVLQILSTHLYGGDQIQVTPHVILAH